MSNPVEDFIISLGFDTSKVTKQITALQNNLVKMADNLDKKRVANGLKAEKQITANVVKETTARNKGVLKQQDALNKQILAKEKKLAKDRNGLYGKPSTTAPTRPSSSSSGSSPSSPLSGETRKQAALRQLRNQIAEYERGTTGPSNLSNRYKYYERGDVSMAKIRAFTEEIRGKNTDTRNRMKAEGSLKSFDSAASSKAEMDMMKASNALEVLRTRMSKMGMQTTNLDKQLVDAKDLNSLKRLIEQTKHQINLEKELNKGRVKASKVTQEADAHVLAFQKQQARLTKKQAAEAERELKRQQKLAALKPTETNITDLMQRYRTNGLMQRGGEDAIMAGAMKQSTQKQAEAYIKASLRAMEYSNKGVGNRKDTMRIISEGNVQVLSKANMQLAAMNAKMAAVERRAIGAAAAFGGMHDSARNMVREMASVYAIMAATGAIKEQVKAVDGAKAGLVAVTNDATEAAEAFSYLKETILQNGLSVKDASKDFVKLKAAMGKDASMQDSMDAFTALAKTGVVFQISQEDMSGTIRALGQIKKLKVCHYSDVM